jgi:hypothetical protein
MKKLTFLVFTGLFLLGCKKYENDPFISTYSSEARLTKGDNCVWTCVKYLPNNGTAKDISAFHYSLSLKGDNTGVVGFSDLGAQYEITQSKEWSLNSNKEKLTFFGEHEIKKLTMNKLELIDEFGNVYHFEKRKKQAVSAFDQGIINIPLFGLFDETVRLTGVNSCDFQGAVQAFYGNTSLGTVDGIFGNGIGGNGGTVGVIKNYTYSFSYYFQKSGYITLWIKSYGIGPVVKLNGSVTNFIYLSGSAGPGQASSWCHIKIKIDSPGNKTISIIGNTSSPAGAVQAIDEIRYWEIQ